MTPDRLAPTGTALAPPTSDARDRIVQALCVHFASDHLTMEQLEERLGRAYRAQSVQALNGLVADLPALPADKIDPGVAPALAPPSVVPPRGVLIAVMGGAVRKGSWLVPRELKVITFMGGAELDLREARFAPGVTEIDVTAIMGGVEIIVPPGVRVEAVGSAFLGGFESSAGDASAMDPAQPVLRLSGIAVMGGVEAKVKRPGKKMLARFVAAWKAAREAPEEGRR